MVYPARRFDQSIGDSMLYPPRYFCRRLASFFVDYVIVLLVTTILTLPFALENTDNVRFTSGGLNFTKCFTSNTAQQSLMDVSGGERIDRLLICDKLILGLYNGRWATLEATTSKPGDNLRTTRRMSVAVNINGDVVRPIYLQDWLIAAAFLLLIPSVMARFSGMTPGRRLLKVRVKVKEPSFQRMIAREWMNWAPVILVALAAYQLSPATLFDALNYNLLWLFVLLGAPGVVAAAWWVLPLFV